MKKLEDYIIVLDGAMPSQLCNDLIKTYDAVAQDDPLKVKRENNILNFSEINMLDHPAFATYSMIMGQLMQNVNRYYTHKTCNILRDRLQCYEPLNDYEAPRIKRYDPGTGVFDWHTDHCDVRSSRRAIVMFWYLNTVEEGGETSFDLGKEIKVKPVEGRVLCFPPYFLYPHKGETPISGPKYVISSYVNLPLEYGNSCD